MESTSNTVPMAERFVDLRGGATMQNRTIDSLIPMVQRSAGRAAVLRDTRLEIGIDACGEMIARFVATSR
jgi:hypothetical protein